MSDGKRIALDYDGTYTAMPEIWDVFVQSCYEAGHTVFFVTAREKPFDPLYEGNNDILLAAAKLGIATIFTNGNPKSQYLQDVDIWIDDMPLSIVSNEAISAAHYMQIPPGVKADNNSALIEKHFPNGATFKKIRECSMCYAPIGYHLKSGKIYRDTNCDCVTYTTPLVPVDWDALELYA